MRRGAVRGVVALFSLAGAALAPSAAQAATYTVNSTALTADASINGICDAGGSVCTLRAAIEESNASTAVDDSIGFAAAPFNGVAASGTIFPAAFGSIPTITDTVSIDGGQCGAGPDPEPCTGIEGTGTFDGLSVSSTAGGTSIRRIAFTNFDAGIFIGQNTTGGTVAANWFGVDLDESVTGNANLIGMLTRGSSFTVGGSTAGDRNWFARNTDVGFHISGIAGPTSGADNNTVVGNYFGTTRSGNSSASFFNGDSIKVESLSGNPAQGNIIGGTHATTTCDGPCNLFGNATDDHIDLSGGGLSAHQTAILGNYIGIGLDGSSDINLATDSSGRSGISLGAGVNPATSTTIGGGTALSRNYIGGNPEGIQTGQVTDNTSIQQNYVGMQPDGTGQVPNALGGILVSGDTSGSVSVRFNTIAGSTNSTGGGIIAYGRNADIRGNTIGVDASGAVQASNGFGIAVESGAVNNAIGGDDANDPNVIAGAFAGIRVNGGQTTSIQGNYIGTNSLGAALGAGSAIGILVTGTANSNVATTIGGDVATEENVISNISGSGTAIRVNQVNGVDVRRNRGSNNSGLFLDLANPVGAGNNVADGSAEGLQPPTATQTNNATTLSGTAQPLAEIRVFAKSTASPGELGSQLGFASADGSGAWTVTIPAQADTQRLAISQTSFSSIVPNPAQTSEYANVILDLSAPPTPSITDTDPDTPSNSNTPAVKGTAEAGSTVRLYSGADCTGPVLATGSAANFLSPGLTPSPAIPSDGTTTFRVTATDAAGNPSPCSAGFPYFTIDTRPPVVTPPVSQPPVTTPPKCKKGQKLKKGKCVKKRKRKKK